MSNTLLGLALMLGGGGFLGLDQTPRVPMFTPPPPNPKFKPVKESENTMIPAIVGASLETLASEVKAMKYRTRGDDDPRNAKDAIVCAEECERIAKVLRKYAADISPKPAKGKRKSAEVK